jgi:PsbP
LNNLILLASVAFSGVLLLSLISVFNNVYGITVNNTDFSVNVLDNWAYSDGNPLAKALASAFGGAIGLQLIPNEFSNLLVNTSQELSGKSIQDKGAFSVFALDSQYPYRNILLDTYAQYNANLSKVKIFSRENATVDGEKALKTHRTPRDNTTNVEVLEYITVHDGKLYFIQYAANVKDYQKYLPQFEQMVKTFKFAK